MAQGWIATGLIVGLMAVAGPGRLPQALAEAPAAASKEIREFEVLLKGKPAGSTKYTIEQFPDGRTVASADALVQVNMIVFVYSYEFHGVETWFGDHLVSFQSHGSDGGKKFAISGSINAGNCQLSINQRKSQGPAFAMTSNYWRLPARIPREMALPIVDASTGTAQNIRIGAAPAARIPLGDQGIPATGYRLTGDVDATLWLDPQGRIVRLQSIEQGYPTELRLVRILRNDGTTAVQIQPNAMQRTAAGPLGAVRR